MLLEDRVIEISSRQAPQRDPQPLSAKESIARAQAILMGTQEQAPNYPLEALGPLANVAHAISTGQQADLATAGQGVLATAALLTQGLANVEGLDGSPKPLSLAFLTIVDSGDGKDSVDRLAQKSVREHEKELSERHLRDKEEYEKGNTPDRPSSPPYRIVGDATVEGLRRDLEKGMPSVGLYSTEAAAVLAGYGFSAEQRIKSASVICRLLDAGHISASRGTADRLERYGVRLSAHLMIQPAGLGDVLSDQALTNIGLWPRWLLAWPNPLPPRSFRPWMPMSKPELVRYWDRCTEFLEIPLPQECDKAPLITLSHDARIHAAHFFEHMEREGRKGELRGIKPFALRATELACRIAGVLTAWEGRQEVTLTMMEGARELVEYSLQCWSLALEGGKAAPERSGAMQLYQWLVTRETSVLVKDIPRLAPGPLRSASRRDAAIELLLAHDLVEVIDGAIAWSAPRHV